MIYKNSIEDPIDIAVGISSRTRVWKNKTMTWREITGRLSEANYTKETYKEYMSSDKKVQAQIKDVGGYVGGYLRNGKRHNANVVRRQLITLDIDFADVKLWDDLTVELDCACVLHGTHKNCEASPRYRLIIPLSRPVTSEEYEPIARKIAERLGIDMFDTTTFQVARLMYWPSTPKDEVYYYKEQKGPFLDADDVLGSYLDWHDASSWACAESEGLAIKTNIKRQEDPLEKRGLIGAFCRTYGITEAIEAFLPEVYEASDHASRYTYTSGTTANGLVVYDNKYAYSNHSTDPMCSLLCNAYDMVRVHKFGDLDSGASTKASTTAMNQFCTDDKRTRVTMAAERKLENDAVLLQLKAAQRKEALLEKTEVIKKEVNTDWMADMDMDKRGNYLSTAKNISLVLKNDEHLKGALRFNVFDKKRYLCNDTPWRKIDGDYDCWKDVDYAGVRNYLETMYSLAAVGKIDDALAIEFEQNSFNPVKDYLKGLRWDGKPRVHMLLQDYFGADNNAYTVEAMKKMLVGAVARIFRPAIKFDLVLVMIGEQGKGKSEFFKQLGKQWFSDSFSTVQGKESFEQIQGSWIIEMAELDFLRKSEIEAVKHYISKCEDKYRSAYARTIEINKRQCVFVGTTNQRAFLKDPSGNRRWLPVDCNLDMVVKDIWTEPLQVDQIWAEAVQLYMEGEPLFLSAEGERLAQEAQQEHSEVDERQGLVEEYVNKWLPNNWDGLPLASRRAHLTSLDDSPRGVLDKTQYHKREFVCVAEIWCECLMKEKQDMTKFATREINNILRVLPGWEAVRKTKRFGYYGTQRCYRRKTIEI